MYQERLEDWEKYLTGVQDIVDVWLKAGRVHTFQFDRPGMSDGAPLGEFGS